MAADQGDARTRLGRSAAARFVLRHHPSGGVARTPGIGIVASAARRFAAGVARPVEIRRQLAGPGEIRPRGYEPVSAPPRWWVPVEHGPTHAPAHTPAPAHASAPAQTSPAFTAAAAAPVATPASTPAPTHAPVLARTIASATMPPSAAVPTPTATPAAAHAPDLRSWGTTAASIASTPLPARGLPRAARLVPTEKTYSPGGFAATMRGAPIPVRRMKEVVGAGAMTGVGARLQPPTQPHAQPSTPTHTQSPTQQPTHTPGQSHGPASTQPHTAAARHGSAEPPGVPPGSGSAHRPDAAGAAPRIASAGQTVPTGPAASAAATRSAAATQSAVPTPPAALTRPAAATPAGAPAAPLAPTPPAGLTPPGTWPASTGRSTRAAVRPPSRVSLLRRPAPAASPTRIAGSASPASPAPTATTANSASAPTPTSIPAAPTPTSATLRRSPVAQQPSPQKPTAQQPAAQQPSVPAPTPATPGSMPAMSLPGVSPRSLSHPAGVPAGTLGDAQPPATNAVPGLGRTAVAGTSTSSPLAPPSPANASNPSNPSMPTTLAQTSDSALVTAGAATFGRSSLRTSVRLPAQLVNVIVRRQFRPNLAVPSALPRVGTALPSPRPAQTAWRAPDVVRTRNVTDAAPRPALLPGSRRIADTQPRASASILRSVATPTSQARMTPEPASRARISGEARTGALPGAPTYAPIPDAQIGAVATSLDRAPGSIIRRYRAAVGDSPPASSASASSRGRVSAPSMALGAALTATPSPSMRTALASPSAIRPRRIDDVPRPPAGPARSTSPREPVVLRSPQRGNAPSTVVSTAVSIHDRAPGGIIRRYRATIGAGSPASSTPAYSRDPDAAQRPALGPIMRAALLSPSAIRPSRIDDVPRPPAGPGHRSMPRGPVIRRSMAIPATGRATSTTAPLRPGAVGKAVTSSTHSAQQRMSSYSMSPRGATISPATRSLLADGAPRIATLPLMPQPDQPSNAPVPATSRGAIRPSALDLIRSAKPAPPLGLPVPSPPPTAVGAADEQVIRRWADGKVPGRSATSGPGRTPMLGAHRGPAQPGPAPAATPPAMIGTHRGPAGPAQPAPAATPVENPQNAVVAESPAVPPAHPTPVQSQLTSREWDALVDEVTRRIEDRIAVELTRRGRRFIPRTM